MNLTFADQLTQTRELIDRMISRANTCLPGIIDSFDVDTQTVTVLPAIQMKLTINNAQTFVDLPKLVNVPIVFPFVSTLGFCLTFPVQRGDSCLLVFSQRAIDNWFDQGGIQPPEQGEGCRHHDLTDAFAIFAPSNTPNTISGWDEDGIAIRNQAGTVKLLLKDDAIEITGDVSFSAAIKNALLVDLANHIHNTTIPDSPTGPPIAGA